MSTTSRSGMRWWMLAIICLAFIELTLNWFDIASAFASIDSQMHVGFTQLGLLISLFLAGYVIFHIPTGLLATRWGLKKTLVLGLFLESIAAILSGLATAYPELAVMRVVTGIGGSLIVGCGFAMTNVWFRHSMTALALGISGGAAFSVGAALGLFPWVGLISAVGWHNALYIGGLIGLVIAVIALLFLRVPPGEAGLVASRITAEGIRSTLGSRDLWMVVGCCRSAHPVLDLSAVDHGARLVAGAV